MKKAPPGAFFLSATSMACCGVVAFLLAQREADVSRVVRRMLAIHVDRALERRRRTLRFGRRLDTAARSDVAGFAARCLALGGHGGVLGWAWGAGLATIFGVGPLTAVHAAGETFVSARGEL